MANQEQQNIGIKEKLRAEAENLSKKANTFNEACRHIKLLETANDVLLDQNCERENQLEEVEHEKLELEECIYEFQSKLINKEVVNNTLRTDIETLQRTMAGKDAKHQQDMRDKDAQHQHDMRDKDAQHQHDMREKDIHYQQLIREKDTKYLKLLCAFNRNKIIHEQMLDAGYINDPDQLATDFNNIKDENVASGSGIVPRIHEH